MITIGEQEVDNMTVRELMQLVEDQETVLVEQDNGRLLMLDSHPNREALMQAIGPTSHPNREIIVNTISVSSQPNRE